MRRSRQRKQPLLWGTPTIMSWVHRRSPVVSIGCHNKISECHQVDAIVQVQECERGKPTAQVTLYGTVWPPRRLSKIPRAPHG